MKYIVWIVEKRDGKWEPNGEGPLSQATAHRISRETARLCWAIKVLPVGRKP